MAALTRYHEHKLFTFFSLEFFFYKKKHFFTIYFFKYNVVSIQTSGTSRKKLKKNVQRFFSSNVKIPIFRFFGFKYLHFRKNKGI